MPLAHAERAAQQPALPSSVPNYWPKIEPAVLRAISPARADQAFTCVVHLEPAADLQATTRATSLVERRQMVVDDLQATARQSQAPLLAYLRQARTAGHVRSYQPFWITNAVAVTADRDALLAIAARPEVRIIRENRVHRLETPSPDATSTSPALADVEWNIAQVGADQVWNALGIDGTGAVVASIDTGVDWQHPALHTSYRGYTSGGGPVNHALHWHCSTGQDLAYPYDDNGHGTHTTGTIVGSNGIGVAPGAKWIAVKAFNQAGIAYDVWLHDAFQWLLAPNGDPALAPDVVNGSWGYSYGSYEAFRDDVRALRAAGIVPVFAAGNQGDYGPGTVGAPASYPESLAVGASDPDDTVPSFSSQGPSPWGIKPDVVAPGVYIRSSTPGGGYAETRGTSNAAPHVSGLAALLRQAQPALSVTDTLHAITSTAQSLGSPVPSNIAGWGRIDAYAAVRSVYQPGILAGTVTGAGAPLANATVALVNHDTGAHAQATTTPAGGYEIGLAPGRYDATATAFGYAPATAFGLLVVTSTVTTRDFGLTALPTGTLAGTVLQAGTGTPLAATVEVVGTPAQATALASTGYYSLSLPVGTYELRVTAWGNRVGRASITVNAGSTTVRDFLLPPAPTILLVDSGAWYYDSQIDFYCDALDDLDYVYHVRPITVTTGFEATQFTPYDVVLWSAPQDAPGYVGAGPALTDYLDGGGKLFVSGQDVGFWDGGGSGFSYAPYYHTHLHARYLADNSNEWNLIGHPGDLLAGLDLTLNGPDSANNQFLPDVIRPEGDATAIVDYAGDGSGGLAVRACLPYRVVYLAFGLEGARGGATRQEILRRSLDWLATPQPTAGLSLSPAQQDTTSAPGTPVTYTLHLRNIGLLTDDVALSITDAAWPTTLWDGTFAQPISHSGSLASCETFTVGVQVYIPPGTLPDTVDAAAVVAHSNVSPTLIVTASLHTKTPAPILLVDGGRWFDTSASYRAALEQHGFAYDSWDITAPEQTGQGRPDLDLLNLYSLVIWWTAYDWYQPFVEQDEANLTAYLQDGGRLFLSSQDYLYTRGDSTFAHESLGVFTYTLDTTVTTVLGQPEHPVGDGLGPYALSYPFPNWSDHVTPSLPADVALVDPAGVSCAITHRDPAHDARVVFFSWPFEALDPGAGTTVMERAVNWLAPLGNSTTQVDRPVATSGDGLTYTITVRNVDARPVPTELSTSLSPLVTYVPGSVVGGTYDPANHRITWAGTMPAQGERVVAFRGTLDDPLPFGTVVTATAVLTDDTGLVFRRAAHTEVNVPVLDTAILAMNATTASPGQVLTTTAHLTNTGTATATVSFTDALPPPLSYVPGSAWASTGLPQAADNTVTWEGSLLPGQAVVVRLAARVALTVPNGLVIENEALIDDGWHQPLTRSATVTIQAPDLSASSKTADRRLAQPGDAIAYTVRIANAGDWPAPAATLFDTLPAGTTYVTGSATGGAVYRPATHTIIWTGTVNTGEVITITYQVTVDPAPSQGTALVNQALVDDGRGVIVVRETIVTVPFRSYLPFVIYNATSTQ